MIVGQHIYIHRLIIQCPKCEAYLEWGTYSIGLATNQCNHCNTQWYLDEDVLRAGVKLALSPAIDRTR